MGGCGWSEATLTLELETNLAKLLPQFRKGLYLVKKPGLLSPMPSDGDRLLEEWPSSVPSPPPPPSASVMMCGQWSRVFTKKGLVTLKIT